MVIDKETSPFIRRQAQMPQGATKASSIQMYATSTIQPDVPDTIVENGTFAVSVEVTHHNTNVQSQDTAPKITHGISKNLEFWQNELPKIPDKKLATRVLDYITNGAPIGITENVTPITSPNWPSSQKFKDEIDKFMLERIEEGSIQKVLETEQNNVYVSPISAFAKKSGKVNVVHDLSFPPDKSINDHISKEYSSVKYTNVNALPIIIKSLLTYSRNKA